MIIKPINNDKFHIKLSINPFGFKLWAMRNLDLVTITKPESLVQEIKDIIKEASERYDV